MVNKERSNPIDLATARQVADALHKSLARHAVLRPGLEEQIATATSILRAGRWPAGLSELQDHLEEVTVQTWWYDVQRTGVLDAREHATPFPSNSPHLSGANRAALQMLGVRMSETESKATRGAKDFWLHAPNTSEVICNEDRFLVFGYSGYQRWMPMAGAARSAVAHSGDGLVEAVIDALDAVGPEGLRWWFDDLHARIIAGDWEPYI